MPVNFFPRNTSALQVTILQEIGKNINQIIYLCHQEDVRINELIIGNIKTLWDIRMKNENNYLWFC